MPRHLQIVGAAFLLLIVSMLHGQRAEFLPASPNVGYGDCNGNGIPDELEPDLDGDGIIDDCDSDADDDGVPDEVDVCTIGRVGRGVDMEGRPLGDIDNDCDTDLKDFQLFQQGFGGAGPFSVVGSWDVFYENNLGDLLYEGLHVFRSNGTVSTNRGDTVMYTFDGDRVEYSYWSNDISIAVEFISDDVMQGVTVRVGWVTEAHLFRR